VIGTIDSLIGEAIGKLYAERFFQPEMKTDVLEIVNLIIDSVRARIGQAKWMSDTTRANALGKLDAMRIKVGYPDTWEDYTPLESILGKDMPYLEKLAAIHKFCYERSLKKINTPVDKDQWWTTPQTVYYSH
jgi:putative endopeptidase